MATTTTGFIISCFAGRAGLFQARLLPASGGAFVDVQVSDLDADPERFNEQLTKVHLFRDAMNRAEPVVVIHNPATAGGNEVESVRRLTRDHLLVSAVATEITGIVTRIQIAELHRADAQSEETDAATVAILDPLLGVPREYPLLLQRPERGVGAAMLQLLRDAEAGGEPVTVRVVAAPGTAVHPLDGGTLTSGAGAAAGVSATVPNEAVGWIVAAEKANLPSVEKPVDGFVESIGVRMVLTRPFAEVLLTTAPRLVGPGRVADPAPFKPRLVRGLVPLGSPELRLLEQARASGDRVRVGLIGRRDKEPDHRTDTSWTGRRDPTAEELRASADVEPTYDPSAKGLPLHLLVAVVVLAPLASAARPVWIRIKRESLDGPGVSECGDGFPSSDLSMRGVASLQVPFRAAWEGLGCFNHGVYRIQVISPVPVKMLVDGKELPCMVALGPEALEAAASGDGDERVSGETASPAKEVVGIGASGAAHPKVPLKLYLGHACLGDLHTVRVEVDAWRCGYPFHLDVMKLR